MASTPSLGVDGQDRVAVAWSRLAAGQQRIESVRPGADGSRERHGDCYRTSFLGAPPIVQVARPDLVRQAFDTDNGAALAGAARGEFMEDLMGQHPLPTLDGEEWLRQHRLLGPPFHGAAIERHREQISEIAAAEIETWPLGEPLKCARGCGRSRWR